MNESMRLEHLALVEKEAVKIFGSSDMAKAWMMQTNLAFGCTPMSMLDKEAGADEVMKVLISIAHGGVV